MKKILSKALTLTLSLLVTLSFSFSSMASLAFADDGQTSSGQAPKVNLNVSEKKIEPGDTVKVTLELDKDVKDVFAYQFDIYYSKDYFELKNKASNAPYMQFGGLNSRVQNGKDATDGCVPFYMNNYDGKNTKIPAGKLCELTFVAKKTLKGMNNGYFYIEKNENGGNAFFKTFNEKTQEDENIDSIIDFDVKNVTIEKQVKPTKVRVYANDVTFKSEAYINENNIQKAGRAPYTYLARNNMGVITTGDFKVDSKKAKAGIQKPTVLYAVDENGRGYREYDLMPGQYHWYAGTDLDILKAVDPNNGENLKTSYDAEDAVFEVKEQGEPQILEMNMKRKTYSFKLNEHKDLLGKDIKYTDNPLVGYCYPKFKQNTGIIRGSGKNIEWVVKKVEPDSNGVYEVPRGCKLLIDFRESAKNLEQDGINYEITSSNIIFDTQAYGRDNKEKFTLKKNDAKGTMSDAIENAGFDPESETLYIGEIYNIHIISNDKNNPYPLNTQWSKVNSKIFNVFAQKKDQTNATKLNEIDEMIDSVLVDGEKAELIDNGEKAWNPNRFSYSLYIDKDKEKDIKLKVVTKPNYFVQQGLLIEGKKPKLSVDMDGKRTYEIDKVLKDMRMTIYPTKGLKAIINFNSNGGSTPVPMEVEPNKAIKVSELPTPFYPDNEFMGWYKDQDLKEKWTDSDKMDFETLNITLYAKWKKKILNLGGGGSLYVSSSVGKAESLGRGGNNQITTIRVSDIPEGYKFKKLTSTYGSDPELELNRNYWIKEISDSSGNIKELFAYVIMNQKMISTDGADVIRLGVQMQNARNDLKAKIDEAEKELKNTNVSDDGKDVLVAEKWISQKEKDKLTDAIKKANAALEGQESGYIKAIEELDKEIKAFREAKKDGLRVDKYFVLKAIKNEIKFKQSGDLENNDVQYKTPEEIISKLPKTVLMTLKDEEGVDAGEREIPIKWEDSGKYDATKAGKYKFNAKFMLPLDIKNSEKVSAPSVTVEVIDKPNYARPIDMAVYTIGSNSSDKKTYLIGDVDMGFMMSFDKSKNFYDFKDKLTKGYELSSANFEISLQDGYKATILSGSSQAEVSSTNPKGSVRTAPGDIITVTVKAPEEANERDSIYTLNLPSLRVLRPQMGIENYSQLGDSEKNEIPAKGKGDVPTFTYAGSNNDKSVSLGIRQSGLTFKGQPGKGKLVRLNGTAKNIEAQNVQDQLKFNFDIDTSKEKNIAEFIISDANGTEYPFKVELKKTPQDAKLEFKTIKMQDNNSHYFYRKENDVDFGVAVLPAKGVSGFSANVTANENCDLEVTAMGHSKGNYLSGGSSFFDEVRTKYTEITFKSASFGDSSKIATKTVPVQWSKKFMGWNDTVVKLRLKSEGELERGLNVGENTVLKVTGTRLDSEKKIQYQWYKSKTPDFDSGEPIDNATNDEYTPNTGKSGKTYYYCVAKSKNEDEVYSCIYTVWVNEKPSIKTIKLYGDSWENKLNQRNDIKDGDIIDIPEGTNSVRMRIKSDTAEKVSVNGTDSRKKSDFFEFKNIDTVDNETEITIGAVNAKDESLKTEIKIKLKKVKTIVGRPNIILNPENIVVDWKTANNSLFAMASIVPYMADPMGEIKAQWYSCDDKEKTNPVQIAGATDNQFTIPSDLNPEKDYYYFCRFTAQGYSEDTSVARVHVKYADLKPLDSKLKIVRKDGTGNYINKRDAEKHIANFGLQQTKGDIAKELQDNGQKVEIRWYITNSKTKEVIELKAGTLDATKINEEVISIDASKYEAGDYTIHMELKNSYEHKSPAQKVVYGPKQEVEKAYLEIVDEGKIPTYKEYKDLLAKMLIYRDGEKKGSVTGVGKLVDAVSAQTVPKYQFFSLKYSQNSIQNLVNNAQYVCSSEENFNRRSPNDIKSNYERMLEIKNELEGDDPEQKAVRGNKNSAPQQNVFKNLPEKIEGYVGDEIEVPVYRDENGKKEYYFIDPDSYLGFEGEKPLKYSYGKKRSGDMIAIDGEVIKLKSEEPIEFSVYLMASDGVNASKNSVQIAYVKFKEMPAEMKVVRLIDAIGEVTDTSGDAISKAREAYDKLSDEQKAKVNNYKTLTDAEEKFKTIQALNKEKQKAIKELAEYKNADDYRDAEKIQLKNLVEEGTLAINAASDIVGVNKALTDAKTKIDELKTDAELSGSDIVNKEVVIETDKKYIQGDEPDLSDAEIKIILTRRDGSKDELKVQKEDVVKYDVNTNTLTIEKDNETYTFKNALHFEDLKFLQGENQVYNHGDNSDISIVANGNIGAFIGVKVNGNFLEPMHYEKSEGSTIVKLKKTYLDTLGIGTHNITFAYKGGYEISTNLTVKEASVTPGQDEDKNDKLHGDTSENKNNVTTEQIKKRDTANTADANISQFIFLIFMLLGSLVTLLYVQKTKKQ